MAHIELIGVSDAKDANGKLRTFPYAYPVIIRRLSDTRHTFNVTDTHLHKLTVKDLIQRLKQSEAKIYGISGFSHHYYIVKTVIDTIREKHKDAIIIVGGVLSGNDDVLMNHTSADIVVTTALGERALPEILDAIDSDMKFEKIKGLTYKDRLTNEIVKTEKRPLLTREEFQREPYPAYEYFDKELRELVANINKLKDVPVKGFPLLTMRGCPFNCTFCGHMYGKVFLRKKWDKFFDELEFLIGRYGVAGFYSLDTNMFLNEDDVNNYCDIYRSRNHSFKIIVELRATFGSDEMFRKLKAHGVDVVLFGFESGSQRMLDRMKKNIDLAGMKRIIKSAIDAGIMTCGNFIFGTPGENTSTIDETGNFMLYLERLFFDQKRNFAKKGILSTSNYGWGILVPSPTSELYGIARNQGLIADEESYLLSLCDPRTLELLKGNSFKIALTQLGGNVNMSEFPSKRALLAYIYFNNSLVHFRTLLFEGKNIYKRVIASLNVFFKYLKFVYVNIMDGFIQRIKDEGG